MDPLFDFEDVVVRFGEHQVLRGVDASFPVGALTVLVGPSGSGKSTMLRLCNRLEVATTGTVRYRGEPVEGSDVLAHRRRVGMVFQRPTLFGGTVRQNLLVADPTLDDDGCVALLAAAELPSGLLDRDADTLSGGEAQRACIARTLATRPQVVLMDEPTSALDDEHRRALERLGRSLVEGGLSIVWVTHDAHQVRRIADVVVTVVDGRVEGPR